MAGPARSSRHSHSRRLWAALAAAALMAGMLTFARAVPRADAAFQGQPWQTNFEIEPFGSANTTVQGPTPPSGGAGVDWDNAANFLQDFSNPTEACTGSDPSIIGGKLDDFDLFAPNPTAGQVLGKGDLCQAYIGWEVINVTVAPGVTELHYILYGAWRRNTVPGEIFFFVPLIGGPTKDDVTLVKFNYDSAAGGSTSVSQLRWNGSTWIESPVTPPESFDASVNNGGSSPSFGEFAIDLTASNILPASPAECDTFTTSFVFTQTGNAQTAELKDFLGVPPVEISNCSQVEVTKVTNPAVPDPPATFTYTLDQVDGGPVQDATPNLPPNEDSDPSLSVFHGSLTVPGSPTDNPDNIIAATGYRVREDLPPPSPWSLQSIVCDYFNPLVLDSNLKATPATVTLTNPDGTWNGQTFDVSPPGLLPAGVTVAADCTITNTAPSLTLVKNVINNVRGPTATPNMWLLSATGPGGVIDYGPGTAQGVSRIVAPGTYTLAEAHNTNPAPPLGYTDGTQWSCTPTAVTGANQITIGASDNVTCTITNTANPAQLTLQKVVDNSAGGSATVGDFTLAATFATPGDAGTVDGLPISGVTGAPSVTDRLVKRGVFNLSETNIPGYAPSWVCVDATGATISTSNQVNVPVDITSLLQLDITCTVTNTFTALDIDISGPSINPVGREHTFTLTATRTASGVTTPLVGAVLDLDFTTENGLDLADVTFVANTCETPPGTDANGQCTVTVSSSASGVLNIIANGFTDQGPNGPNPGTSFDLPSPVSSNKRWREYRVEGAASDINLIGEAHTFTLSGFQIAGTTSGGAPNEGPLQQGAIIRFTWSGPGTPIGPTVSAAPGGGFQCVVGVDGTCAVTVTSATPASGTLSVTGIVVELLNGDTPTSTTTYTLTYPDVALQEPAPVLTKSWVAFNVTTSPSSVNLIREAHTFTINVTQDVGGGPVPVADGTIVNYSWSGIGTPSPPSSCVTSGGSCTVTVTSNTFGAGTLTVTGLSQVSVTVGSINVTFPTVIVDASGALTVPPPVEKRWVLVNVAITPGVDNLAGEPHTFTVQVTAFDGLGGFPDGSGVPGAIVAASAVAPVGGATLTTDGTCDEGTDANGQCTLIVTNPGSGSIVVQLDQVALTVDGAQFVIPLTAGSAGLPADEVFPIQSDKVWWQYRVVLSDSSTNPLGVDHTFIATVQRTNDGGVTWQPVPDGAHLDYTWTDPNNVSDVDPASTCLTTGTVGGTCTFVVSSTAATTGTLTINGILDTWLDRNRDGDRGAPGDPTPDPAELAAEIVDVPASAFGTGSVLNATKTWFDFAIDVTGPAENPVGLGHTFTATVLFSDGSAAGFQPVSEGTTLTYTWSGPTGSAEDTSASTCDPTDGPGTNASGQCTVVVTSPTVPGPGTLTITGIDATTIPQPTRDISFTFPTPATTTKTWIALRALISPSSVNLAGNPHTFTITVQLDMGGGFASVADGTKIAVLLSDPTKLVSETCSTTGTVSNQCTVTVNSDDPGSVIVTPGAITVELLDGTGARVPVTVQPGSDAYESPNSSTKVWVAFRLGVTQSAINLVGDPHGFEVSVEFATEPNVFQPVGSGTLAFAWNSAVGTIDAAGTTCPTLSSAGTCTLVVTSDVTGTGTLTLQGLSVTTVNVNGVPTQFTNVNATNAPNAITFTRDVATKTWVNDRVTVTPDTATNYVGQEHTFTVQVETDTGDGTGFHVLPQASVALATAGTATFDPPIPTSCVTDGVGVCTITTNSSTAGTLTLTATYNASIGEATVPFTDTASKTWIPPWTLTVAKASSVTNSAQLFGFHTEGPAPLSDGSFPLAIGQTTRFEGLLPGTYSVSELVDAANLPAPWKFASVECTGLEEGATVAYEGSTATLTLADQSPGTDITCTFTNEQETTVVPEAVPPVPPPAPAPTPLLPFTGSDGLPDNAGILLLFAGFALVMVSRRWRRRNRLAGSDVL